MMKALAFWKTVTVDEAGFLERLVSLLDDERVKYCVVGGQGVNAYVEPVVSLDLDLAVAVGELERLESLLRQHFRVDRFPHSLNVSLAGSDLRVQIQLDPRYDAFVGRASFREVLGVRLPVAALEDVLQGRSGRRRMSLAAPASARRISPISPGFWSAILSCALARPPPFSTAWSRLNPAVPAARLGAAAWHSSSSPIINCQYSSIVNEQSPINPQSPIPNPQCGRQFTRGLSEWPPPPAAP